MSMRYQAGVLTASYFPLQVPNAPFIGTGSGGDAQASITFTAPVVVGGGAITSYIAIVKDSSSGAVFTNTGASSPIVVTGLTNGNIYTATVAATNAYGTGPASLASDAFAPGSGAPPTVEYLVVAGGGGAGDSGANGWGSGGGGAGGYRTATGYAVSSGSPITVTVGSGGAGGSNSNGVNGSNSVFGSITSAGGGGGGQGVSGSVGSAGGSGGGGSGTGSKAGGAGTAGQGYAGGNAASAGAGGGGGGGGASGVGANGSGSIGGAAGPGSSSSISGSSVTYAAGGIGGSWNVVGDGSNGAPNTGNGGGGANATGTDGFYGGSGGSGIVIIRYPTIYAPASTTGSPTVTTSGSYRIYKWTSSGSITF
jgi:hypothetical protein